MICKRDYGGAQKRGLVEEMNYPKLLIVISLLLFLLVILPVLAEKPESVNPKTVSQEKKTHSVNAESVEQLVKLIESALESNVSKQLVQVKALNLKLVNDNKLDAIKKCNSLLDKAIKEELSGKITETNNLFQVCRVLGEMYRDAVNNNYLLDKVSLLHNLSRENKEKYRKAEELYNLGETLSKKNKHSEAIEVYDKGLDLYREIGYKEGEANCLLRQEELSNMLDDYKKAYHFYDRALVIYRERRLCLGEATTLHRVGDIHLILANYDKAKQAYNQALIIFRKMKSHIGEANSLWSQGELHRMVSDCEKALTLYEQALSIRRKIGDRLGEAYCLFSIGNVEKKSQSYEQALLIFKEIKSPLGEANCLSRLGQVFGALSDYKKAGLYFEQGLLIYRKIKHRLGEAYCLGGLGNVNRMLNNYTKANQFFKKAITIYQDINYLLGEANCLQYLAESSRMLSDFEEARKAYERALKINLKIKNRLGEANCFTGIGELYRTLSYFRKSYIAYEKGLEIYREIKSRIGEANCLQGLGDLHKVSSDYLKASQTYREALNIYHELNHRSGEANCLYRMGNVYRMLHDVEKAHIVYNQALVLFRDIESRLGEANCLTSIGELHWVLSDYERVKRTYDQVLLLQKQIVDLDGMRWTYYRLGQTFEALKNKHEAKINYINSIRAIEGVWKRMKLDQSKTEYMALNVKPYKVLIAFLFKQKRGIDGFYYAERSKARSFLYLLGNRRVDLKKGLPPDLAREEEVLRQKITAITLNIMQNEEKEKNKRTSTKELKGELLKHKQRHSEIIEKMKLLSPEYASLKTINPLSVEEIQGLVRQESDTVLIEYYTTEKATYLWLLDGEKIYAHKIDVTEKALSTGVEEFRVLLNEGTSGSRTLASRAGKLYKILLEPVEKHLQEKTRIAVVPHGILHYLPFEAMMNEGKFLVEQGFKFFYLPSASVYKYCREKNPLKKDQLMAIANPDGTLPYSEKEVKEIKKIYRKNARIFIGNDAKESTIKENVSYPDILHFACHGIFDSDHPMYSCLKLTPDTNDDGRLEVNEIFNLKLKPAYLVTLSACETKLGKMYHGDEIVGMSRAFIYAGTPSIVASLWKVDDYYTAKFMASFYKALKKNDKIDALDIARKTMIKKYGKRHPFYWAAFVLIGDPR